MTKCNYAINLNLSRSGKSSAHDCNKVENRNDEINYNAVMNKSVEKEKER